MEQEYTNCMRFLRIVLGRCVYKPLIIVDRGPWYRWAIDIRGLRYRYQRFSLRSTVERFYNNINTWSIKNNKKHIQINENSRRRITWLTGSYSF
jgi:transposase-like protein